VLAAGVLPAGVLPPALLAVLAGGLLAAGAIAAEAAALGPTPAGTLAWPGGGTLRPGGSGTLLATGGTLACNGAGAPPVLADWMGAVALALGCCAVTGGTPPLIDEAVTRTLGSPGFGGRLACAEAVGGRADG
jgi:hypothetical protein